MARNLLLALALLLSPIMARAQPYPAPNTPLTGSEIAPCIQNHGYKNCTTREIAQSLTTAPIPVAQLPLILGSGQTSIGQIFESTAPGPVWGSYASLYIPNWLDLGGFPANWLEFGNSTPGVESVVGTAYCPVSDHGSAGCFGVSGYAVADGTSNEAVGLFGVGMGHVDSAQAWGFNTIVQNCVGTSSCATNTGHSGNYYGGEIDININKESGTSPLANVRGLYIIGGSEVAPVGGAYNAIDIDSPGIGQNPHLAWADAVKTEDGAAVDALHIGALGVGNGYGSQNISLNGKTSGGSAFAARITTDSSGNLLLQAPAGAIAAISSNGACGVQSLPTSNAVGCALTGNASITADGFLRPGQVLFANLATADPSAAVGDMLNITDASACTANTAVSAGGGSAHSCPTVYNGVNWIALVTH